jgi:hypothetical protein
LLNPILPFFETKNYGRHAVYTAASKLSRSKKETESVCSRTFPTPARSVQNKKAEKSLIDNDVIETTRNEDTVTKSVDQTHSWDPNWLSENSVVITKVTLI